MQFLMNTTTRLFRLNLSRSVANRSRNQYQLSVTIFQRAMSTSPLLGESKWFESELGPIHYRAVGPADGEPLVFVHGALVNADAWRKVIPLLSDKYRCYAPDLPIGGHNKPTHPDAPMTADVLARTIGSFVKSLGLKQKPTLIANDTGGALTQVLIAQEPDLPSRVVLTSCDAFKNSPPGIFYGLKWAAAVPGFTWAIKKIYSSMTLARSPAFLGFLTKKPVEEEVIKGWTKNYIENTGVQRDVIKLFRGINYQHTVDAAKTFPSFNKPVLIAWAAEDKLFPTSDAEKLHKLFPKSELTFIKDSYAFIFEDQPQELAKHIREFLAKNKI